MRLPLFKEPNRVGVSLLSPEDETISVFQNVVFSSYLEFRTVDKVHIPSDSENQRILREYCTFTLLHALK
jgi:hypothetical protein